MDLESHAHIAAKASFCIWAERLSVSDIDREAYAMGFHPSLLCCCNRTAPKP